MEQLRRIAAGGFIAACLLFASISTLTACGGSGDANAAILSLFVGPAQTIDAGQTTTVTASLVGDSTSAGASFAVTGGGTLSSPTTTYVGTTEKVSVRYTAPAAATVATVTATSIYTPSQSYPVIITVNPPLVITTTSLATGTVGVAYSAPLTATGGTGTDLWSLANGTLPSGLSLNTSTGAITGAPTNAGIYSFTIGITDSATTPLTAVQTFVLTVNAPIPVVTVAVLPGAIVGVAYSQQLAYTGGGSGLPTWTITAGSLPAGSGLALSPSGLISGTPTTSNTTYNFTVTVAVGTQISAPVAFTVSVLAPLVITTASVSSGHVSVNYSQQLALSGGSGGTPTWTITSGSLPSSSGLTLSPSGLVSGIPTTATSYTFGVTVSVGAQTSAPVTYTLNITSTIVTSGTTATGEVTLPFAYPLTAIGGTTPYTWTLATGSNALPPGLTINAVTGLISGTPISNTGSPYTGVVVQATDSRGAAGVQTMTITINPARTSANNAELNGHYAFLLSGFDASHNPADTIGSFVADGNGNIVAGVLDSNGTGLSASSSNTPLLASTYAVGADKRGRLTLTTASGSTTYVISLNSLSSNIASGGSMAEFDATGQSRTGEFALQSTTAFTIASITGGYAFGAYGFSANSTATTLKRSGTVGEVQLIGTGTVSSAEFISLIAGTTPTVPVSGTINISSNGRGTLSLVLPASGGTENFFVYVVAANKLFLLSSDPASGTGATTRDLIEGQALSQTAPGTFATVSLDGTSVFREQQLVDIAPSFFPDAQIGLYAFDGAGNLSGSSDENSAGTAVADSFYGTYTVAANGRATLYRLPSGFGGCSDCVKNPTYFYLIGANQGFLLDFGGTGGTGYFEPQSGTSFSATSLSGSYSMAAIEPANATAITQSGVLAATPSVTLNYVEDQNSSGLLSPDQSTATTYTVSTSGRAMLGTASPVLYIVSPMKAIWLDLSSVSPVVQEIIHQ